MPSFANGTGACTAGDTADGMAGGGPGAARRTEAVYDLVKNDASRWNGADNEAYLLAILL